MSAPNDVNDIVLHAGLKVNDQLVANAIRFLAVHLKNQEWSHHHALKAKLHVRFDFSRAYSHDHTNILQLTNWGDMGSNPAQGKFSFKRLFSLKYMKYMNLNREITQPGTR